MGYKKDDPCIAKAYDDERLFVLMARDPQAPEVIIKWIQHSLGNQPDDKIREALECAIEMQNRGEEFRKRKEDDDNKRQEERKREQDKIFQSGREYERSILKAQTTRLTDLPFGGYARDEAEDKPRDRWQDAKNFANYLDSTGGNGHFADQLKKFMYSIPNQR